MRILITGGTSGIMYNLASKLVKRGHLVYLTTHTKKEAQTLKKKLKDDNLDMLVFKLDITNKEDRKIIKRISFDVFISHAGVGYGGSLLEMDTDVLRRNYEVNVFSSFELIKEVYQKWKNDNQRGKIFVMGSQAALIPLPFLGCYTSSKASIAVLTNTIREELKYLKSNITITLIEPGAYKTGFNQVMIDNKEKYLYKDSLFSKDINSINKIQRNFFSLIESSNIDKLTTKILKEIEASVPKKKISCPFFSYIFLKIYAFFKL